MHHTDSNNSGLQWWAFKKCEFDSADFQKLTDFGFKLKYPFSNFKILIALSSAFVIVEKHIQGASVFAETCIWNLGTPWYHKSNIDMPCHNIIS
jgi:hypothetical protein